VRITAPTIAGVQPVLVAAFRAHGLPRAIRCDHGAPFAGRRRPHPAVGVVAQARDRAALDPAGGAAGQPPPRAQASHAQGADLASAGGDVDEQQARCDAFRRPYNLERPHEALGQRPPAAVCTPSPRALPKRVEDPWYDADHRVRRVPSTGAIEGPRPIDLRQRGPGRRAGRHRRPRDRRSGRALRPARPRPDRSLGQGPNTKLSTIVPV
jgi:hypothetical protein